MVTETGWFAARPSGTEDVYKLYAESFRGPDHLAQIQDEAREIVSAALVRLTRPAPSRPTVGKRRPRPADSRSAGRGRASDRTRVDWSAPRYDQALLDCSDLVCPPTKTTPFRSQG